MKVQYDKEADASFIQLSSKHPEGAVEINKGVIIHTTDKNEVVGI